MKKPIVMGLLLLTAAVLQAFVNIKAIAQTDVLAEMDQDKDGMISIREAVADLALLASFGRIDTDGDGKISASELETSQLIEHPKKHI